MSALMHDRTTAQSLLLQQPHALAWVRDQLPELGPLDLLLRTRSGAISLGAELPLYLGQSRGMRPHVYPFMTGYKAVAEMVACGPAVQSAATGERVVAFYGHRTMTVAPEARVVPIPPDMPDVLAVLFIFTCDAAESVRAVFARMTRRVKGWAVQALDKAPLPW
jgi:alcohol dehydrogenase